MDTSPLRIVRYAAGGTVRVGVELDGALHPLEGTLGELLTLSGASFRTTVEAALRGPASPGGGEHRLLPPIDCLTEVWASGVTYSRSSDARQEESQVADVYARVYDALRPELFFKSTAWRTVGHGEPIGVRPDSAVDVPEPELALVCSSAGEIVGLTICDDVSSRSIEGENPLYLPQAKIYAGACALGPGIVPIWAVDDIEDLDITVAVVRDGETVWGDSTSTGLLHRRPSDLVAHLFRASTFPHGVVLSTGTGLVPDLSFTLRPGDRVDVDVAQLGRLSNPVRAASAEEFAWLTPEPDRAAR